MPAEEATEDFDLIFGEDDATGSMILMSSPIACHKRSASKDSNADDGVREEIIIGGSGASLFDGMRDGREEDEVDYEIGGESPKRIEPGSASMPMTPAKANELLDNILSKRPPKLSTLIQSSTVAAPANQDKQSNKQSKEMPAISKAAETDDSTQTRKGRTKTEQIVEEGKVPEKRSSSVDARPAADKGVKKVSSLDGYKQSRKHNVASVATEPQSTEVAVSTSPKKAKTSEKSTAAPAMDKPPSGYAKQNHDALHQQAVDKKREADQLKDGKELPVYLKAVTTYAQAYCYYELFGPDPLEKWKGLSEFCGLVEKKCAAYKNDITVGLCNAIKAWIYEKMLLAYVNEAQSTSLSIIGGTVGEASTKSAQSLALGITKFNDLHVRLRQSWLKAVNLVPALSKYGFSMYSAVEELVKTVDRYI